MAVKNSDMYYAYSNNEGIKEKGEYGGVVTTIVKHLLESNVVDGIVAVKEGFDLYDAVPCLITDPEEVIKLLKLPKYTYPIAGLCIGYPADESRKKPRLPFETFVHRDEYSVESLQGHIEKYDE